MRERKERPKKTKENQEQKKVKKRQKIFDQKCLDQTDECFFLIQIK